MLPSIRIRRERQGNLNPKIYSLLKNVTEEMLYYKDHSLRHPLGIYNTFILSFRRKALASIFQFEKVIELFKGGDEFGAELMSLLDEHRDFLFQVDSLFDVRYIICKSFVPRQNSSNSTEIQMNNPAASRRVSPLLKQI